MIQQRQVRSASELAPTSSTPVKGGRRERDRPTQNVNTAQKPKQPKLAPAVNAAVAGKPKQTKSTSKKANGKKGAVEVKVKCPFCGNGKTQQYIHAFPTSCPYVKRDSPQKWANDRIKKLVTSNGYCRNCFQPDHEAAKCTGPEFMKCRIDNCNKRHHAIFHEGGSPNNQQ